MMLSQEDVVLLISITRLAEGEAKTSWSET